MPTIPTDYPGCDHCGRHIVGEYREVQTGQRTYYAHEGCWFDFTYDIQSDPGTLGSIYVSGIKNTEKEVQEATEDPFDEQ